MANTALLPASRAMHHEPQVKTLYEHLRARGKVPLQALVAVMRKLLHALYSMLRTDTDFDSTPSFVHA